MFWMSKDDFIKKFKQGSEAWKVLLSMAIAKEKTVNEKIKRATRLSLKNRTTEIKSNHGFMVPTLIESAGLRPSQPDYYDIRGSMKKIIDKVYSNDRKIISRAASPERSVNNKNRGQTSRNPSSFNVTKDLTKESFLNKGTVELNLSQIPSRKTEGVLLRKKTFQQTSRPSLQETTE